MFFGMKILLLTPPLTQLNTPYPATPYLKGFLTGRGYEVTQADLGIELILEIFSKKGLEKVFNAVADVEKLSENSSRIFSLKKDYAKTINPVIRFLQNKDSTLAYRICQDGFLPQANRFSQLADLEYVFGEMGIQDKARHLATMYIEDIGDFIIENITAHFGFSRYAEQLAMSATSFEPIETALQQKNHLIDDFLIQILDKHLKAVQPNVVGFTVPFPGNLYGALKCGQHIKTNYPNIKTLLGGGYANTELRDLKEPKVFKYIDFITLDDGESPLLKLFEHLEGKRSMDFLQRTFTLENGAVSYINACLDPDIPHSEIGTPDYSDLLLDKYLSIIEVTNPMHRLWSDGRWNKLTVAHGCYWKRCSFCDVTLDYIGRYDKAPAELLADRIETLIEQTGETGFHFVDEAAPPLSLRDLALELIQREISISWWANIRFEKTFTPDLCRLLAESGCIAVSGGLEVASDRLLDLMEKGVSVAQVARVTKGFADAGIMVHAYLMYGFPTQTKQETIDSLEVVRQLFEQQCIQSAFWHRFSMTVHSPVGKNPEKYKVKKIGPEPGAFANNDLIHEDPTGANHDLFTSGLKKALYNYMHHIGLDIPVREWFDFRVPKSTHRPNLIKKALYQGWKSDWEEQNACLIWVGASVKVIHQNETEDFMEFSICTKKENATFELSYDLGEWLNEILPLLDLNNENKTTLKMIAKDFEANFEASFEAFIESEVWEILRKNGLLLLKL
jgi:radical SAM superfamily enzyme YgiQ (UPF0313 family)